MATTSLVPARVSPRELRDACGNWVTGVSVVTSADRNGSPVGMAVNSFTSLSLEPPLILFCPAKKSLTWPHIRRNGRFVVNILAAGQVELPQEFAKSGGDKFARVDYRLEAGLPVLADSASHLVCTLTEVIEGGDHEIAVAHVDAVDQSDLAPLIFHRGRISNV